MQISAECNNPPRKKPYAPKSEILLLNFVTRSSLCKTCFTLRSRWQTQHTHISYLQHAQQYAACKAILFSPRVTCHTLRVQWPLDTQSRTKHMQHVKHRSRRLQSLVPILIYVPYMRSLYLDKRKAYARPTRTNQYNRSVV